MLRKEAGDRSADRPSPQTGLLADNPPTRQLQEGTPGVSPELAAPLTPVSRPGGQTLESDGTAADEEAGLTMADLLGPEPRRQTQQGRSGSSRMAPEQPERPPSPVHSVDDFDFDEEAFLAALDENEPVGATGEVVSGVVIAMESDGVYVDIGGKAPGFMPKTECGLGVIVNLKERFPKGTKVEVLVTREQNADGMVTISARALELRHSWEKVRKLQQDGKSCSSQSEWL
jgi:small subunit ribosomal protein S1